MWLKEQIKRRIYIAGPLFSEAEREFNQTISDFLEKMGNLTFLPQRDGHELCSMLKGGVEREKANRIIFNMDIKAIQDSDVVVFVMDGRVPDEGACVEIGYAYALGKECIGLKTDSRSFMADCDNPMILGAIKGRIARNLNELADFINEIKINSELTVENDEKTCDMRIEPVEITQLKPISP